MSMKDNIDVAVSVVVVFVVVALSSAIVDVCFKCFVKCLDLVGVF